MSKRNTKTEASGLASPAKRTRRVKTKPSAADKRARATERIKAKARCKRRENVMLLMPFINSDLRDKKGKRICGRDWWDVKETGDYIFDCALGNTLAEAYLRYAKERGDSPSGILSYIVDSMIEKGHDYCRGVRIGFLGRLAQALPEGYYFQESTEGEQIVLVR